MQEILFLPRPNISKFYIIDKIFIVMIFLNFQEIIKRHNQEIIQNHLSLGLPIFIT